MKAFHSSAILVFSIVMAFANSTTALARVNDADGSAKLVHAAGLDATYEAVLNELKKEGLSVDSASKDAGIKTATSVSGRYHQTGMHLDIQFVQDSSNETTVRVAALKQTRYKALNTEPWSSPNVDVKQSQDAADKLKAGLGW